MPPKERQDGAWDNHERRRRDDDVHQQIERLTESIKRIDRHLDAGSERMGRIEESLAENTKVTTEVREVLIVAKGGLRVIGGIGTLALWVGKLAAALAAIYSVWYAITHGGALPPKG